MDLDMQSSNDSLTKYQQFVIKDAMLAIKQALYDPFYDDVDSEVEEIIASYTPYRDHVIEIRRDNDGMYMAIIDGKRHRNMFASKQSLLIDAMCVLDSLDTTKGYKEWLKREQ